jgi:hypothetical protein
VISLCLPTLKVCQNAARICKFRIGPFEFFLCKLRIGSFESFPYRLRACQRRNYKFGNHKLRKHKRRICYYRNESFKSSFESSALFPFYRQHHGTDLSHSPRDREPTDTRTRASRPLFLRLKSRDNGSGRSFSVCCLRGHPQASRSGDSSPSPPCST